MSNTNNDRTFQSMSYGKVRIFLVFALLNVAQGTYAQGVRAVASASYGFGAQSVRPEYASEHKDDAAGPGFLIGAAYDTKADTTWHFRIRLAWHRNYWEQSFRSTYGYNAPSPYTTGVINVDGMVRSRIDQLVATPALVVPISKRFHALFGADLGLIVGASIHDQSRSELTLSGGGPPHGGYSGPFEYTPDSTWTNRKFMNTFQFGLSAGLEMHLGDQFSAGAEFSLSTSKLVSYSREGAPPKYMRFFLGYRLARKR
ncbi:MAG: hypothetical protein KBF80_01320 [Flavobacteriales bacterium]|nr:hypothetical protein [Flavobacteriales bacterium]